MTARFKAPKRLVNRVFIHCSDSDNPAHDNVKAIREWHVKERGWRDIGYHYVILKSGRVEPGRDIEISPAAQAGNNVATIAVCLTGREKFSDAQFQALRDLCHAIHAELPLVTFHGHREVNAEKTCPNFNYKAVLDLTAKGELT